MKNMFIGIVLHAILFYPIIAVYAQPTSDPVEANFLDLSVKKNNNLTIVIAESSNNLSKLASHFSVEKEPSHGYLINPDPSMSIYSKYTSNGIIPLNDTSISKDDHTASILYTPKLNYTGPDSFTFNTSDPKKVGNVFITINPPNSNLLLNATPVERVGVAFVLSIAIVIVIFLITYLIIKRIRNIQQSNKTKFWDIIRDDNWYPSLAIFQFLLWTGIVLFSYLWISLISLFTGTGFLTDIPYNLILVMGISAAVPVIGAVVSEVKYGETTPPSIATTKSVPSDQLRRKLPGFKTMLMENGKITLPRFQMFAWTWIGIIAYLGLLFWEVGGKLGYLENISLPELPILFVSLMGLSQVTYLAAKSVKSTFSSVSEVRPGRLRLQKESNNITIIGSNFGTGQGTIWIEAYPPITEDEKHKYFNPPPKIDPKYIVDYEQAWKDEFMFHPTRLEEQYNVTPNTPRQDNRIEVNLDKIRDKLKPQKYVVRVEKDGLLTYATVDATFEVTYPWVVDVDPADNSTNVPIDSSINATFNEPMRISTIKTSTFILNDSNNNKVAGIVETDGKTATFKPTNNLSYKTLYIATITTEVINEKGNPMPFEKTWSFITK
jgi:hypothetical protein